MLSQIEYQLCRTIKTTCWIRPDVGLTMEQLKVTECIYMYVSNWISTSDSLHIKDWKSVQQKLPSPKSRQESPAGWLQNYAQFGHVPVQRPNFLKWWQTGEQKNISRLKNDDTMYNTIFLQEDSVSNLPCPHLKWTKKLEKPLSKLYLLAHT